MDRRRRTLLVVITVVCIVAGAAYVIAAGPKDLSTDARPQGDASDLGGASLMVRGVEGSDPRLNGKVFLVKDGQPEHPPGSKLACERVYYSGGHGLCMAIGASGVDFQATIFDSSFHPVHELALTGLPSRARVSSDGRYGAMTVFVAGHAYLGSSGGFSTTTTIVDMSSGRQLGQLEQFHVTKDRKPFDAVDFNFWGVTFAPGDSDRFYATLGTGGHHYLVEGSVSDRSMRVLRDGVECPSLSPDGKRIAFKSRIGTKTKWRLKVLDLATLEDHPVAEHRSIDDQAEWLDDDTLVYSDGVNVYTVPADGGGEPQRILRDATSPVRL